MSAWTAHLVGPEAFDLSSDTPLPQQLPRFLAWQGEVWPRLGQARAALADVEQRVLQVGSRDLRLQFNPGRVVNSTAAVDAASIEKRPCFLCPDRLPEEEKGLAFGPDLVILANPAPILDGHLVLAHRSHRPQSVTVALDGLLDFALATEGHYTVVYNGPTSGASAPDHLHLQAVTSRILPEEVHAVTALETGGLPGVSVLDAPGVRAWSDDTAARWVVGFVGQRDAVGRAARSAIAALGPDEPPLNLVATTGRPSEVVLLVFPRGAHRPRCYFADPPDRRLVSPGAIDMAGVVVTVRHEDYSQLRPGELVSIFGEVSRPADADWLSDALRRRISDG